MSAKRPPSVPPNLPGFDYVSLLGSGGFADVFLYQQHLPSRQVAVKVLLPDALTERAVGDFRAEANVMAQLSSHPAIVNIYEAGVSNDGRPYLVMENCPRPNLQARYRKERFGVADALRIGIQVAGAVETAHRAGVLHRDIKPANILVTAYNRPALTDFGIAGAAGGEAEAVGMSIPWSPPESFADEPRSSPQSDVYALGATIYTLLAGRSPFEVPGERNTGMLLIERIQATPVPALNRPDVPRSLEMVLATAMAKSPSARYGTALELARALQKIQIGLSMSVTQVDVLDEQIDDDVEEDEDDGRTRLRPIVSIDPSGPAPQSRVSAVAAPPTYAPRYDSLAPRESDPVESATVIRAESARTPFSAPAAPQAAAVEDTVLRAPTVQTGPNLDAEPAPRAKPRGRGIAIGVTAAVVVVIAAVALIARPNGGKPGGTQSPTSDPVDGVVQVEVVPTPTELVGVIAGDTATFTWSNPEPKDGDTYLWATVSHGDPGTYTEVSEPTVAVPSSNTGETCVAVVIARADGKSSEKPAEGCAS